MNTMLESFANPSNKDQLEERMARIKEDPSLKPILEEIGTGGPAAMMRLAKLGFIGSWCLSYNIFLLQMSFGVGLIVSELCCN